MKMTVSEYIFARIAEEGVKDVFMVSGGGIMYLCDALGRNKNLQYWCNYNEQACAIAAESHARVTEKLGVCLVTTGPGSTNALTGVAGAWVDSIPILVISGQVRTAIMADYRYQRQVGPQEINIIPMAEPVTKYAVTVMDPKRVRYELEKALHLATHGRPGPVWLNIPLDVQSAEVDSDKLEPYRPECDLRPPLREADVEHVVERLKAAKRPVIIGGAGVALGKARQVFTEFVSRIKIPVLLTMSAMDLLPEDDPHLQGRFGPAGQRHANFALQNADLVLAVGTSLSISCIGFADGFAPKAYKILVNTDAGDLEKRNVHIDFSLLADTREFLSRLLERCPEIPSGFDQRWLDTCADWKRRYPATLHGESTHNALDMFSFIEELSCQMRETDILVGGNSHDGGLIQLQGYKFKSKQRSLINFCFGAMGWDLPALVGACIAAPDKCVVLTTGDGSLMFSVHELLFLGFHRCNAKIFVSNNNGYMGITKTQDRFFSGNYVGAESGSGVANPDFALLAKAFGLNYCCIDSNDKVSSGIAEVLSDKQPWLCELITSRTQQYFRVTSYRKEDGTLASRPLEDMDPLLPRDELARNMRIFD